MSANMIRLDGIEAYLSAYEAATSATGIDDSSMGIEGATPKARAISTARNGGDDRHVSAALAMMDRISAEIETEDREFAPAPFGGCIIVPEAIIGYPMAARRMMLAERDSAPVRISVSLSSAVGLPISAVVDRGVALLTLIMALSKIRPVELHAHSDLANPYGELAIMQVRIPTAPLSLAQVCHFLTEPRLTKHGAISIVHDRVGYYRSGGGKSKTWREAWERGDDENPRGPYLTECRELMGWSDRDIVIPRITKQIDDLPAWINGILARINQE